MTKRQAQALEPLLEALKELGRTFPADCTDSGRVSPGIYLPLTQWRAIERECGPV